MNDIILLKTMCLKGELCNIQLGINDCFVALPSDHSNVTIAVSMFTDYNPAFNKPPILLDSGHYTAISALALSNDHSLPLLCSCSSDYIILWDLLIAQGCYNTDQKVRGAILTANLGDVHYCSFSPDDKIIAISSASLVYIFSVQNRELLITLEGHTSDVTCVQFCQHSPHIILSLSTDRTFKMWDMKGGIILYQSPVLSSSSLLSIAFHPLKWNFVVGSADGHIWVYDFTNPERTQCLHSADVSKLCSDLDFVTSDVFHSPSDHTISTHSSHAVNQPPSQSTVEVSFSILAVAFNLHQPVADQPSLLHQYEGSIFAELLGNGETLYVVTTASLLQLNPHTLEVLHYFSFKDHPISLFDTPNIKSHISTVSSAHLYISRSTNVAHCVVTRAFEKKADVISWNCNQHVLSKNESIDDNAMLTMLSSVPILETSPLRSALSQLKNGSGKNVRKKTAMVDKAVTFHSKIKSSGYTASPRTTMFKPAVNKPSVPQKVKPSSSSRSSSTFTYPVDDLHPSILCKQTTVSKQPCPIYSIHISDVGDSLACALANSSAHLRTLPLTSKSKTYTGHSGSVEWVRWSHSGKLFLTSSKDHTARVWSRSQDNPILTIDKTAGDSKFNDAVKFSQFYFLDQFILLVHGDALIMYKYSIDSSPKDDVKRYLNRSHYKAVTSQSLKPAKQITALSAVNSFNSYIVLAATSDRGLCVLDMNRAMVARRIYDVHSRPCHSISIIEGSNAVSHPAGVYDLFFTSAITDGVKLWDLRATRCVRKYECHQNRSLKCGLAVSACGRYLAAGSEDKSVYVYDIRGGAYLERLGGHSDAVSDVKFYPTSSRLISATYDGELREYTAIK